VTRFPFLTVCGAIILAAGIALPAGATVKDGVDAWQARNYARAVALWRAPAAAGDPDAQFNLAQAYKLGRGVPANLKTARGLFEKAANQGHEQAQANLGLVLFQLGDRQGAIPWLQRAADRGEPRAQYVVGTAHFNGDLAPKDWPRAYALMSRAAATGLPQAVRSLAQMEKFIPLGQRQQGNELARSFAAAANAADAGEDRATLVMAGPNLTPGAPQPRATMPGTSARPVPAPAMRPASMPTAAHTVAVQPARPALVTAARAVPAPAAGAGGWRVQLGAFGTPVAAQAAWATLGSMPGVAGLRPMFTRAGAFTRLQAGPLPDRAAAARACAAIARAGKACFPVAP
jgi:cell division septation protein DedD